MSWTPDEYKAFWIALGMRYGMALLVAFLFAGGCLILAARIWLVNPLIAEARSIRAEVNALRR